MKRFCPKLILVFSYAIFASHTLAQLPEAAKNQFIGHHQRQREARLLERTRAHQSQTFIAQQKLESFQGLSDGTTISSNDWAGAAQPSPPSGKFNSVSAQWTLPTVSRPPSANGSGEWFSSEWVGIDGYFCQKGLLQAGTSSYVQVTGIANVSGASFWYEWYPRPAVYLNDFSVAAGDTVEVSVTAESKSLGKVVINNFSTGKSTWIIVSAPNKSSELCGVNAEWIVEDFSDNGLVPFSSFTDVSFRKCVATTTTGDWVDLTNTTLIKLVQNNTVLATPALVTATELRVSYG